MKPVLYDGTFEGFLTTVFEVYEYKIAQPKIRRGNVADGSLFGDVHAVHTNNSKAKRVLTKLDQKILKPSLVGIAFFKMIGDQWQHIKIRLDDRVV